MIHLHLFPLSTLQSVDLRWEYLRHTTACLLFYCHQLVKLQYNINNMPTLLAMGGSIDHRTNSTGYWWGWVGSILGCYYDRYQWHKPTPTDPCFD